MFSSLQVRNYRLFMTGQVISLSGTWMQGVAQAWLVLEITGSGTALGVVTALQFLPVLFFGSWGGVVADRFDKRRLLYITQVVSGLCSLILGLLIVADVVQLWMIYALAMGLGAVKVVENPVRQSFVLEMVGPENLPNAVSLNAVTMNLARIVGPALAGGLIATVGLSPCFFLDAASYVGVMIALAMMRSAEIHLAVPQPRAKGQLREGFRYVRSTPGLFVPLVMMAVIGTLGYEFQVVLPLMAKYTFHGGAGTYGVMTSMMGGGAVVGGLLVAARRQVRPAVLSLTALLFGLAILGAALAPTLLTEYLVLVLVGAGSISFLSLGNATLQLTTAPHMRGRVMGLWTVALIGTTPIGGPIIGWIGEHGGPRYGLLVGAVATMAAGLLSWRVLARVHADPLHSSAVDATPVIAA